MEDLTDVSTNSLLGVLGGLGPEATVAFMSDVIEHTPAKRDQDHIEMIVYNDPKVPDRNYPDRRKGKNPLPHLRRNAKLLEQTGVDLIVIPSNTTHRYYDDIAQSIDIPILHMISTVRSKVESMDIDVAGVLTTETAIEIELYDDIFQGSEVDIVYPNDVQCMMDSIYAIKQGDYQESTQLMDTVVSNLSDENVDAIILGCTEFSIPSWDWDITRVDSTTVLAKHCVEMITGDNLSP